MNVPPICITRTQQTIRVVYSAPVTFCARRLRVFPPETRGAQRVTNLEWRCFPPADEAFETHDDFGNRVLEIRHRRLARDFRFEMDLRSSRAETSAARDENLPSHGIGAFVLPSALCDAGAPIRAVHKEIDSENFRRQSALHKAETLCRWTFECIEYSIGATQIETTASQSLARGVGVCQDFAHVMIALCRLFQIPARYISGFNASEGAMHAWVETLCDDRWISFDPTHGRATRNDCVFVACGRDFRDVSPIRGAFSGVARVDLKVACRTQIISQI